MPIGPLVGHWQQRGGTFTMHIDEKLGNFPLPNPWEQAWPATKNQPLPMVHDLVSGLHSMLQAIGKPLIAWTKAPPPSVQGVRSVGITQLSLNYALLVNVTSAMAEKSFIGTTPWCLHCERECVGFGGAFLLCAWCTTLHRLWALFPSSKHV